MSTKAETGTVRLHRVFKANLPFFRLEFHQRRDVLDQRRDVHRMRADRSRPGEFHEIVENHRQPPAFRIQHIEIPLSLLCHCSLLFELFFQQVKVQIHRAQRISQFMRHARR